MPARFRSAVLFPAALIGAVAGSLALAPPVVAAPGATDPLPRFEPALCPGVSGLKLDAAEYVVGRIRANAETLGLRMDNSPACKANLLIVFVDDGQTFLEALRDERGYLFAEMPADERDRLFAETGPAHAFLLVRQRSRDGMLVPRANSLATPPSTNMWMAHSLITVPVRSDIISALILFDRQEIAGLTLDQLADYATFRALTHTLPDRAQEDESILALFDGGDSAARPAGLTAFDRAWLAGLYDGLPNVPGTARLADMEDATTKASVGEGTAKE